MLGHTSAEEAPGKGTIQWPQQTWWPSQLLAPLHVEFLEGPIQREKGQGQGRLWWKRPRRQAWGQAFWRRQAWRRQAFWSKGSGKPFTGTCWTCGVAGHRAGDCPQKPATAPLFNHELEQASPSEAAASAPAADTTADQWGAAAADQWAAAATADEFWWMGAAHNLEIMPISKSNRFDCVGDDYDAQFPMCSNRIGSFRPSSSSLQSQNNIAVGGCCFAGEKCCGVGCRCCSGPPLHPGFQGSRLRAKPPDAQTALSANQSGDNPTTPATGWQTVFFKSTKRATSAKQPKITKGQIVSQHPVSSPADGGEMSKTRSKTTMRCTSRDL